MGCMDKDKLWITVARLFDSSTLKLDLPNLIYDGMLFCFYVLLNIKIILEDDKKQYVYARNVKTFQQMKIFCIYLHYSSVIREIQYQNDRFKDGHSILVNDTVGGLISTSIL